jgi:DNA-binding MarR family transcriptional regulator
MDPIILEQFLPYRLHRIGIASSDRLRAIYGAKLALTVPEWRVFATLAQYGKLTAKAVGIHSGMHKTKISRAVEKLENRRWLVRSENQQDRREEFLTLSRTGQKVYASILPDLKSFETAMLSRIKTDRVRRLLRALDDLETALGVARYEIKLPPPE